MTENQFVELADQTLESIADSLEEIEEIVQDADISLSQGVLKIDLGEHGTWVINRQIPNRQIWWSSPMSGPQRYEYKAQDKRWRNTRDNTDLMHILRKEISAVADMNIQL